MVGMSRDSRRTRRRAQSGRLVWILLALVLVLLIVSAVTWVLYLVTRPRTQETLGWQDPISSIEREAVVPELALYPLAGASVAETVDASIASGEPATAYALLQFDVELTDAQRGGRLIQLGAELVSVGSMEHAAACYRQAVDIAILSPNLGGYARAQLLLDAGRGLREVERRGEALTAFDQVLVIAEESPYLPAAHSREFLGFLEAAYLELGEAEKSEAAAAGIVTLDTQGQRPSLVHAEGSAIAGVGDEIVSSPGVGALEESRRQAAYAVLQANSSVGQVPSEVADALAEALRVEDAAKLSLYHGELEATSQPGRRIGVHWQLIQWLLLKYQVAYGGFGMSVVPEWEQDLDNIRLALGTAFGELEMAYEDFVSALPQVGQIGPATYEWQRTLTLAGRRGVYPDYPVDRLATALTETARGMIEEGLGNQLYVEVRYLEAGVEYRLSPASRYGESVASP